MKCPICHDGETATGATTLTVERGVTTLVTKSVPARVCDTCGEAYVDEATTTATLCAADVAADAGVLVGVMDAAALDASLDRALEDEKAGRVISGSELIAKLRASRATDDESE